MGAWRAWALDERPGHAHAESASRDAGVLEVTAIERPMPRKNEVLIRVKAAGLDYDQWHLMACRPYVLRVATGLTRLRQHVLGMNVRGAVEAVGAEVTCCKVGDAVFGAASQTFTDFTCARADQLCLKPRHLSVEQAAVPAISGVAAPIGLRDVARVKPGQSVCVIGAGGGGSWAGAARTALRRQRHGSVQHLQGRVGALLGAASVIDYTQVPFPADGRFDVIIGLPGHRPLSVLRRALAPRGTLVLGGGEGGDRFFGGLWRTLCGAPWSLVRKQRLAVLAGFVKPQALLALSESSSREA